MTPQIPLFELHFTEADRLAADRVLATGWMSSGPQVAQFEADFGRALGVEGERVVAVSSCTAALHLALLAAGIGPGDEVIVPALTFVAASNVVRLVGAEPVFADITSLEEPNLDPESVAPLITPRTRALVPVHFAGHPCRVDSLRALAEQHGLVLIEDAAHACITRLDDGRVCGTLGDFGAFSFFANKNLAVGEGGALVCRSPEVAQLVRRLRSHGMTTQTLERHRGHAARYDVTHVGTNARLDEWRAAVLCERLRRLPAELARRAALDARYRAVLADGPLEGAVSVPFSSPAAQQVPAHIFPVVLAESFERDEVVRRLREERGVQCSVHYPLLPAFAQFATRAPRGEWRRAARWSEQSLTLPFFPTMREEQVAQVAEALNGCLNLAARQR